MTLTKRFTALFTALVAVILMVPSTTLAASFGISPPWIVNENIKQGTSFVYVIDLNTDDPSRDQRVTTRIQGSPELSEWIKIRGQENLVMPKGQNHVPMYVDLSVPADARLGRYQGNINIQVEPKDPKSGEVAIALGGTVEIDINVVDYNVTDYFVKSISIQPVSEGHPIDLSLTLKNLGNTRLEYVPVRLEILDYKTGELVGTASADALTHPVYPHTVKDTSLRLDVNGLPMGTYWASLEALKDGEVVYKNRLYLSVDDSTISSTTKTTVQVTDQQLKPSADETMKYDEKNRVSVKTQVTVRAPLTNQLIGVVIALLTVLIVIIVKMYGRMNGRGKKRK